MAAPLIPTRSIVSYHPLSQSGLTPEDLALALAFGFTCGIFPVPGVTTVPTLACAYLFGLNAVATQLTNLLATPVNLATVIPFIRAGEWLFGVDDPVSFSLDAFSEDLLGALKMYWVSLLRALAAWLVFMIPATIILNYALRPVLRVLLANIQSGTVKQRKAKESGEASAVPEYTDEVDDGGVPDGP